MSSFLSMKPLGLLRTHEDIFQSVYTNQENNSVQDFNICKHETIPESTVCDSVSKSVSIKPPAHFRRCCWAVFVATEPDQAQHETYFPNQVVLMPKPKQTINMLLSQHKTEPKESCNIFLVCRAIHCQQFNYYIIDSSYHDVTCNGIYMSLVFTVLFTAYIYEKYVKGNFCFFQWTRFGPRDATVFANHCSSAMLAALSGCT